MPTRDNNTEQNPYTGKLMNITVKLGHRARLIPFPTAKRGNNPTKANRFPSSATLSSETDRTKASQYSPYYYCSMSCAIQYYQHAQKQQSFPKVSSEDLRDDQCFKGHTELRFGSLAERRM